MKIRPLYKRISALICALALVLCTGSAVQAEEMPDLTQRGGLSLQLQSGGKPVSGGQFTLYQVGRLALRDNLFVYELTGDFRDSELSLEDLTDPQLPEKFWNFAQYKKLAGRSARPDANGGLRGENLELGVYLLVQTQPCPGYQSAAPFLVTIPGRDREGVLLYQVDASPKMQLDPEPSKPQPPKKPEIPYTGQLNWPVPILAVSGAALFILGWIIRSRKEES